jgi:inward rectifier potassium channel
MNPAPPQTDSDLGLSGRIAQSKQERMMLPDGSLNIVRLGERFWESLTLYQHLLRVRWPVFWLYVLLAYAGVNAIFASLYVAAGPDAISGGEAGARWHNAIFFSVQTIATIGYGQMTPRGTVANLLVALEALVGLMGFALATGILFARFSRPTANILRSSRMLVSPYKDITALMFRIANGRRSQLIDVHATVTLSRMEDGQRKFHQLALERASVMLLPTQWVIVHPIGPASPLWGLDQAEVHASDPEVFVLISATEESFSQVVHSRFSYADNEIVFGARFAGIFGATADGVVTMDLKRLSAIEPV